MSQSSQIRFLHLHTFYPDATAQLYQKHPELKTQPFIEQMQSVLEDGFSAAHIFTPYLAALGYETQFIVADNPHAQAQWLRENNQTIDNQHDWVREIAKKQIEAFKPDVLYSCNPIVFDSTFIRNLRHKPRLVMGWRGADIDDTMDFSAYDVILSGLPGLLAGAQKLGAQNAAFFFPGFPVHIAKAIEHVEPRFDVVFSGSWTQKQHQTRNEYLEHVAAHASVPGKGFSASFFLAGDTSSIPDTMKPFTTSGRFGMDMHRALKSGRLVLDARANHRFRYQGKDIDIGGEDTVNMRIFEALGSGCFLLTEHFDGIQRYFEPGKELVTFKNKDDLIEKIRYYLNNPFERRAIASRGQARCHRDYNMEKQAQKLDAIIQQHLPDNMTSSAKPMNTSQTSPSQPLASEVANASRLLRTAIDTFKQGNYADAFRYASQAKTLRIPILNIDYLRAASLLHLGKPFDAREALREELHFFPGNESAQQLLDEVLKMSPPSRFSHDDEFLEILSAIRPHTMVPEPRLYSLYTLAKRVCAEDIPGNFVECGVARGGSTAMLGLLIQRYSKRPRIHFGFDSFEGMPEPTVYDTQNGVAANDTGWGTGTCAGSIEGVQQICDKMGVSDNIQLIKGYFEDTLASKKDEVGPIAFLHLDADWYQSTMTILNEFYDQVVPGGLLQFDDYGCWDGCRKAVDEFQQFNNIQFDLQPVPGDTQGMWTRKP